MRDVRFKTSLNVRKMKPSDGYDTGTVRLITAMYYCSCFLCVLREGLEGCCVGILSSVTLQPESSVRFGQQPYLALQALHLQGRR